MTTSSISEAFTAGRALVTRLRQRLHTASIDPRSVRTSVLSDLASVLEHTAYAELPPITPTDGRDHVLSLRTAVVVSCTDDGISEIYHIPFGLRLQGDLSRTALYRTLDRILARHEVLRTTFAFVEGEAATADRSGGDSPLPADRTRSSKAPGRSE